MRLGTTTTFFATRRDGSRTTFAEQLKACADAGFEAVDLDFAAADALPERGFEAQIAQIGEALASTGLVASQACAPYNDLLYTYGKQPSDGEREALLARLDRTVKACAELGVGTLVLRPLNDTVNTEYDPEAVAATNREFYLPTVEAAVKAGVGVAFENMCELDMSIYRRTFCASVDDLELLTDGFGDRAVGVCWNFARAHQMMTDQAGELRRMGAKVTALHVSDASTVRVSKLVPFVGNVKWEKLVPVLREIGYSGDFVLDAEAFMNNMPDDLRPDAARIAVSFAKYCMAL